MKIKNFVCDKICEENLKKIETEINAFTTTNKTVDVKVNTASNNFGAVIVYTVLYQEE